MNKCKVRNYKGIYPPKCNKGKGCDECWRIWGRRIQWLVWHEERTISEWMNEALKMAYDPTIKRHLESNSKLLHLFK